MKPASIAEMAALEPQMAATGSRYSFKATWQAICNVPCNSFPLTLVHVHPIAAPFILWQLKGKGYSNCRVVTGVDRLIVYADR